jgi:Putative transposase/Transposase zinc-binding domain
VKQDKADLAHIIRTFGNAFNRVNHPNTFHARVLNAITQCRTSELGGHAYVCQECGTIKSGFNSCRNRHCPKCQGIKQALWVDDLLMQTLPVKHFHIVFTIPHELNQVCLLNSEVFFSRMFASAWETIRTFGYTKFGAESGAICVLHTWGQNLSFHPHLHCIVPAVGMSLAGNAKQMNASGKFLYPVKQLSASFRAHFMRNLNKWAKTNQLTESLHSTIDSTWNKDWVVFCEPSMAKAEHVVRYLGLYTHRVAITNNRIVAVDDNSVTFLAKDYADGGRIKTTTLSGVEFLRRFCMHILPLHFVKIRRFGIYSSRCKDVLLKLKGTKKPLLIKTSIPQRIKELLGCDVFCCPECKKGQMVLLEVIPRTRSPATFYNIISKSH